MCGFDMRALDLQREAGLGAGETTSTSGQSEGGVVSTPEKLPAQELPPVETGAHETAEGEALSSGQRNGLANALPETLDFEARKEPSVGSAGQEEAGLADSRTEAGSTVGQSEKAGVAPEKLGPEPQGGCGVESGRGGEADRGGGEGGAASEAAGSDRGSGVLDPEAQESHKPGGRGEPGSAGGDDWAPSASGQSGSGVACSENLELPEGSTGNFEVGGCRPAACLMCILRAGVGGGGVKFWCYEEKLGNLLVFCGSHLQSALQSHAAHRSDMTLTCKTFFSLGQILLRARVHQIACHLETNLL